MISARMHICTHTHGDPKLVCPRIFIHPSARFAGVSLMHMYRGRVWLVLWPRQRATISIRTCKFRAGRRTYASRRERVSQKNSASGVRHSTDLKSSQTCRSCEQPRKSEAKRFEDRDSHNGTAKAARVHVDFCNTCYIATISSNQVNISYQDITWCPQSSKC